MTTSCTLHNISWVCSTNFCLNKRAFPAESVFASCDGASDGSCNSNNILALYEAYITGFDSAASPPPYVLSPGPTNRTYYATGLCTPTIDGYSDWYLPAICEMDALSGALACPSGAASMVGNLSFLLGEPGAITPSTSCTPPSGTDCFAGYYWSSTERSYNPQNYAWLEYFSTGGSLQGLTNKDVQLGVRCSRALTL